MAHLHLHLLGTKRTRKDVNKALITLPTVLDDYYDQEMARIRNQDQSDASLAEWMLGWTVFTRRPLTVRELQHALATNEGETEFSDEFLVDAEEIISVCRGLVSVDQQNDTVRLMHESLQDYLTTNQHYLHLKVVAGIGYVCLYYLDLDEFDEPCPDLESLRQRLAQYAFSRYAARYWADHIRGDEENQMNTVLRVFKSRGKRESMSQIEEYETRGSFRKSTGKSLLHIVAANGLATICHSLLSGTLVDSNDPYGQFVSRSNC